jgi:flagellar biosynthesis GTPase FlhF
MPKFNKSQVFEKIKSKLGASQQISDRTINDTLENLMVFAGEETELDAFVTQISGTFVSMDGNLRHEVAEKARLLKEAEPKQKTAEELAAEKAAADAKAKSELEEPAWAKANRMAQEERFAAMEAKLTGAETAKTIAQKREAILASSKAKYAENVVSVASKNFDFSKEGADVEFEATCTEIRGLFGVKPPASAGGSDVKPDYSAIKAMHGIK